MQWKSIFILILFSNTVCFAQTPLTADSVLDLLAKNPQEDTNRVLLLNQLAFSKYYSDPIFSFRTAFKARKIADSLHFTRGEADAYRQIGLSFWAHADMPTAISYYLKGLRIAEVNNHVQVEADITGNLGTAYNGLGNPKEALIFLNRALKMQQQLNNRWREASVLNNIGDSYLALKDFQKATEIYTQALQLSRENKYKLGISTNTRNLGNVQESLGNYESALTIYFHCITLTSENGDNRGNILSHKSIASVYLKTGKLKLAEKYAQLGLTAATKINLRAFMRDLYELLAKVQEAQGNQTKAFGYFKLFTAYKDSVQNLGGLSDVAAYRLRFETEKKQTEIEVLKKETELQSAKLAFKNSQLLLITLISFLTLLFLILTIANFRKIKGKNKMLLLNKLEIEKQNIKLSEQGDELTALNEELRSQQDQVVAQRDELAAKNAEIEKLYNKVIETNENLGKLVAERTAILEQQNKHLKEYAFFNAHKLRAPVASILGLVSLLERNEPTDNFSEYIALLKQASNNLDQVTRTLNDSLHEGIDTYGKKQDDQ
jgi:tetratricopeptide (TPR) repeat protein